jgi:acyl-CoA synthetase (AMP-forming)/AMP-acid ligase II
MTVLTNQPPSSPQISEAAVVALPSEQWGQKVAAVVVLHPSAQTAGRNGKPWGAMDMRRALRDRLAAYKVPQEMKVLDSIPRNAMGKGKSFILHFSFSLIALTLKGLATVETC